MTEDKDRRTQEFSGKPQNNEDFRMKMLAEVVAEETIFRTFRLLGVDIRDQDSLNRMREDLGYLHNLRKDSDSNKYERRKSLYQNAGALIGGLLLALVGYYIGKIHGLP